MPRRPRFNLPGYPQHVIQRGNIRQPCFRAAPDYQRYLDELSGIAARYSSKIHAYVLMTNHVHLLVSSSIDYGISQMMQAMGRRYVYYFNRRYRRTGTLWEGRFKAGLVDADAYLLSCMRYIELNPVRAAMVKHPSAYRWSSYAANAQGKEDDLVSAHACYLALGASPERRQTAYRALFDHSLDDAVLDEIRSALNRELVLGRPGFKDRVETLTHRPTRAGRSGRPRKGVEEGNETVALRDGPVGEP